MAADSKFVLIGRKDGSSSSRRQHAFADGPATARAITRWEDEGFNGFWVYGPVLAATDSRPLLGNTTRDQETEALKSTLWRRG